MSLPARALWLGFALAVALPVLAPAFQEQEAVDESSAPEPLMPVPSEQLLAWQELEVYGAIRFGPRTFGGDPFEPSELDCRQWAEVAHAAGLRGLILDVSPDGFDLWPSATSSDGVQHSPWRAGRADVLRELAEACRELDLRLGVELAASEQLEVRLEELCLGYGELFEVRIGGLPTESTALATIQRLQPTAVVVVDGVVRNFEPAEEEPEPEQPELETPTGDEPAIPTEPRWVATETSVSIRPERYWQPDQDDDVKTPYELEAVWLESVGQGSSLCVELAPDRSGRVPAADVASLQAWASLLELTHEMDLARGARTLAEARRGALDEFVPRCVVDGDANTFWATDDDVHSAQLEIDLGLPATFNRIVLGEYTPLGQRITSFTIQAFQQGEWRRLAEGAAVGRKRVVAIPTVTARRVLVNLAARGPIALATLGLHLTPPRVTIAPPGGGFLAARSVELSTDLTGATIHYTLDGSEPSEESPAYGGEPLRLDATTTVRARSYYDGIATVEPATASFRRWSEDELLHPLHLLRAPEPGLRWQSCEGDWSEIAAIDWSAPVAEGITPSIDVEFRTRAERVALLFEGYLQAPEDAVYTFHASCNLACRIQIGDRTILDHSGGAIERSADVGLRLGWHPIRIEALNPNAAAILDVHWSGAGFTHVGLADQALGH